MRPRSRQAQLAEGLAWQGHVAPAVEACYEALRLDEADPLVHALLADLFLRGDFYDEAITAATRAIELDTECAPAYLALGLAYDRRGGMWDRSVLVWNELAEVVPDLVTAHVQLGEALSAAAFDEEAIAAWKEALRLDPRDARAMYDLALAALKKEGMATALPGFRKAGELDRSQDDFFFSLAGLTDRGPAPDIGSVPGDRDSRLRAAQSYALHEDYFAAADLIREILRESPDDADVLALAGYLYLKQEAVNEAMAVALRGLALSTKTPAAVYVL
jgi:tetratricopeptide (TPR) repeat protein